jgi:hypothetical protein
VLLQAMWRRPRGCLRDLMQKARTKAAASGYKKSVAEIIEEDLLAVLEPAMQPKGAGGDAAARRGRNISLGVSALGEWLVLLLYGRTWVAMWFWAIEICIRLLHAL